MLNIHKKVRIWIYLYSVDTPKTSDRKKYSVQVCLKGMFLFQFLGNNSNAYRTFW